ncbi:MAG: peptide deformylase [Pseudomonadota bacterium]
MAVLEIIHVPDPRLSTACRPMRPDELGPEFSAHLKDMAETMYAAPGVGLAAPQVGDLRRYLVADPGFQDEEGKQRRGIDLIVMINPEIVEHSKETCRAEEGCLSVPDLWEDFVRPSWVVVRFLDEHGQRQERRFEGFPATVVQHEMDHLDGVTILDKVSRFKRSRYLAARRKARQRQE